MTVEITPRGNAATVAQQLLFVADNDPRFRVDDVRTTTHGPMGLAFLVPDELHEAWVEAFLPKPEPETDVSPQRRARNGRKAAAAAEPAPAAEKAEEE